MIQSKSLQQIQYIMRIIIIFLILLLSGCATQLPPAQQAQLSWKQRQHQLNSIRTWRLSGATAIQTQEKALSASISWQQDKQQQYVINLFGPLGLGAVKLAGTPQLISLYADQHIYTANSPEQLLQENLGWQLPVSNLYYWIRGLPAPNSLASMAFDAQHHLSILKQQDWQINYISYQTVGNIDLPRKIVLQSALVKATIVINSWQVTLR